MKKILIATFFVFALMPAVFALNLEINKISERDVIIAGIDKPAIFELEITNLGSQTKMEIYNLVGMSLSPSTLELGPQETKTIELKVSPLGEFDYIGPFSFDYYFRDTTGAEVERKITFTRTNLENALDISAGAIDPESNSVDINIENQVNYDFENIKAQFNSSFFDEEREFTLGARETKAITINLDQTSFRELLAGVYSMDSEISSEGAKATLKTALEFEEKNIVETKEDSYGFIIRTNIISKSNEGNLVADSEINVEKNILSRLFTTVSPEPDRVERDGAKVTYYWMDELQPGESLVASVKTNWIFPLILLIIIIAVVIIAKQYAKTDLSLKKKVSFVKTKGGEFAIKVSLYARANKYIENVTITDRLPPLVKIYEKFGSEKPSKVNPKGRILEWTYDRLEPGEVRLLTYVIYSKVGVLGKFALPSARAIFEKAGHIKESESNRAFFVAEQNLPKEEE